MRADDKQFCPLCGVSLDLHDGPDSCEIAEERAHMLDHLDRLFGVTP